MSRSWRRAIPGLRPVAAVGAALAMVLAFSVSVPVAAAATDTDNDGLTNAFETTQSHTDPLKADTNRNGVLDPAEDPDGDGLGSLGEQRFGTDPLNRDTDGDGIADGREDSNGNGISNAREQDRRPIPSPMRPSVAGATADRPISYTDGCHTTGTDASIHPCVYGDPTGKTTIVLFGDSHAAQWLPALMRLAMAKSWRIVSLTKSACPSVRVTVTGTVAAGNEQPCNRWRRRAVAWIAAHPPDAVLVSNFGAYPLVGADGHRLPRAKAVRTWRKGLEATLRSLPPASKAIVLADTPRFQEKIPACLVAHASRISACVTPRSQAIDSVHLAAEKTAAAATGATFANLGAVVCPYNPCPVIIGHFMMWRDAGHLTATYARQLAPSLRLMLTHALAGASPGSGR